MAVAACKSSATELFRCDNSLKFAVVETRLRIVEAKNMQETIKADFKALPHVLDVEVNESGTSYDVFIHMDSFGRTERRRAYASQKEFYRAFPSYSFWFVLVDESQHQS